jgi:DNA-binding CsgD family transcriptional regulator
MKSNHYSANIQNHSLETMRFIDARFFVLLLFIIVTLSFSAFADNSSAVASRIVNGETVFYYTLPEAFKAASGTSINNPDEIILLADCVLDEPIIIEDEKHIRLISLDGEKSIHRGEALLEYPVIWLRGNNASFSLGKDDMGGSIVVDGGYLRDPSIEALAPLVAVNGLYAKCIMYDNVALQNNYSINDTDGTHAYRNGAGVFIRTIEGNQESQAEFIMKGGIIQGNINNNQNPIPLGGGVLMAGFGLFTMESGIIRNNSAYRAGGGFHAGSRASFNKTGGIIYGKEEPENYRNFALIGAEEPVFYGHALSIALVDSPKAQYRDDTVDEHDNLSYIGSPTANGVFGKGEKWDNHIEETQQRVIIIILAIIILAALIFFLIKHNVLRWKTAESKILSIHDIKLSPREKEIAEMLLSGMLIKEIAFNLGISYSTTTFHVKNLYRKLGIQNQTELLVKYQKSS